MRRELLQVLDECCAPSAPGNTRYDGDPQVGTRIAPQRILPNTARMDLPSPEKDIFSSSITMEPFLSESCRCGIKKGSIALVDV